MGASVTRPRVIVVVQARLGSTRLPGKALMDIAGRPMLAHVLERAGAIEGTDSLVLATTDQPRDERLVEFARAAGVPCVRGSEQDVLDRFHVAVQAHPCDAVVRISPDCPLLDPDESARVVARYRQQPQELDFVSNVDPPTYPDGLDTELFSCAALETAWKEARRPSEREHVTPYIRAQARRVGRSSNVEYDADLSAHRWTVDTAADLEFVRAVYAALLPGPVRMRQVLDLLERRPELRALNAGQRRNEGYERSLAAERAR